MSASIHANGLQMAEFSMDSVTWLQHKGFSIEPSRGFVERGQTKTISISWVPPADFDVGAGSSRLGGRQPTPPVRRGCGGAGGPAWQNSRKEGSLPGTQWLRVPSLPRPLFQPDHPLMVSALLQLRGDVKETYKVIFVANVVTGP